jgi:hypothetical protein
VGTAFGVEADLARGQDAPLGGVDLRDEVAVARERDVLELEQDLEARRPALLRLVGVRICRKSRVRFSARFMPMPPRSIDRRAIGSEPSMRRRSDSCPANGTWS